MQVFASCGRRLRYGDIKEKQLAGRGMLKNDNGDGEKERPKLSNCDLHIYTNYIHQFINSSIQQERLDSMLQELPVRYHANTTIASWKFRRKYKGRGHNFLVAHSTTTRVAERIQAFFREVNTYPQMSAALALPASGVPSFNTPG